jgi:hypothetical protein
MASPAGATSTVVGGEVLLATVTAGIVVLARRLVGGRSDPGMRSPIDLAKWKACQQDHPLEVFEKSRDFEQGRSVLEHLVFFSR